MAFPTDAEALEGLTLQQLNRQVWSAMLKLAGQRRQRGTLLAASAQPNQQELAGINGKIASLGLILNVLLEHRTQRRLGLYRNRSHPITYAQAMTVAVAEITRASLHQRLHERATELMAKHQQQQRATT
jgi:hypothetical protein